MINDMTKVSNTKNCKNGATKNVGYYYRVVFPNVYGGAEWCFRPEGRYLDGGVMIIDGKTVISTKDNKIPMSYCQILKKGNHVLEVFGAYNGVDNRDYKW
jgi:hypothetical protein